MIEMEEIRQAKIDSLLIKSVCSAVTNAGIAVPVSLNQESVHTAWEALKTAADRARLQVPAPVSSVQMEYLLHMKPAAVLSAVTETIRKCREYIRKHIRLYLRGKFKFCTDTLLFCGDTGYLTDILNSTL